MYNNKSGNKKNQVINIVPLENDTMITGVSGRFLESLDIEQYAERMLKGDNEEEHWMSSQETIGRQIHESKEIDFIGIDSTKINRMDLKTKMVVACVYDAIFDAGVNPSSMCESKTALFIATCEKDVKQMKRGLISTTCMKGPKAKLAVDVMSVFGFHGQVYTIENQECSMFGALDQAMKEMESGNCQNCLVVGIDNLNPEANHNMISLGLNMGCIFLQKRHAAKRVYARVMDSKLNREKVHDSELKDHQPEDLQEVYNDWNIDPSKVTYVENCVNNLDDKQNMHALIKTLAVSHRKLPLYVSSTKSSIGPMSGMTAIMKTIISIQRGVMPASTKCQLSVVSDKLKKITSNMKLCRGLIALNAQCDNDSVHILLEPNNSDNLKQLGSSCFWNMENVENMPRLLVMNGITKSCLEDAMIELKKKSSQIAAQCLLESCIKGNEKTKTSLGQNVCREFSVLNCDQKVQEFNEISGENKPVFYVFSGLNYEWQGTCQQLMKLAAFKETIMKLAQVLQPHGLDLISLMKTKESVNMKTKVIESFVAITALQIALIDCLCKVGMKPEGIIGHSIGELACAYADGALTAEETILVAMERGQCIEKANLPAGSMANVCLNWEQVIQKCPSGVVPASHNHQENVTVSGPKEVVEKFVNDLKKENIDAKIIDSADIAFHSHFITSLAPQMKNAIKSVIKQPKNRSSKWISTSIPEKRWNSELAQTASADYFVNNLVSHVLFCEALKMIPKNAIVIEIGPSNILKKVLQKNLSEQTTQIELVQTIENNQLVHFWTQLGRLFNEGLCVQPMNLIVPREMNPSLYPVPVNTRFLSNIARLTYQKTGHLNRSKRSVRETFNHKNSLHKTWLDIDLDDQDHKYLLEHRINGHSVLPVSTYIYMLWKAYANMSGIKCCEQLPVKLDDVTVHKCIDLTNIHKVNICVEINETYNTFRLIHNDTIVCEGRIQPLGEESIPMTNDDQPIKQSMMDRSEIYRMLKKNGYDMGNSFQFMVRATPDGSMGEIECSRNDWISKIDAMMQMNILSHLSNEPMLSSLHIESITINPEESDEDEVLLNENLSQEERELLGKKHDDSFEIISWETSNNNPLKMLIKQLERNCHKTKNLLTVIQDKKSNTIYCDGIQITNMNCKDRINSEMKLENVAFVSYIENEMTQQLNSMSQILEKTSVVDANTRHMCQLYLNKCRLVATVIIERIKQPTRRMYNLQQTMQACELNEPFESNRMFNDGKLLKVLTDAATNMGQMENDYLHQVRKLLVDNISVFKALQNDKIINRLPYECNLRSTIDTVLENVNRGENKTLRILEIACSYNHFYGVRLNKIMLENYPDVEVDYKFVSVLNNPNKQEILSDLHQILSFPIHHLDWNLLKNDCLQPTPNYLKNFDLVIFNSSLSILKSKCNNSIEVNEWLKRCLIQTMKPQGFMMIHEFTENIECVETLLLLEQMMLDSSNMRPQTPMFQNVNEWRKMVEQNNLCPVSIKSDSCLSSVLLYHRPCDMVSMQSHDYMHHLKTIDIDKKNWITNCKKAMVNGQYQRVLLLSCETPNNQILQSINHLRLQNGGNKLRCLFMLDNIPIKMSCLLATLKEMLKHENDILLNEHLIQHIVKTDLFMNVIMNGKWGSFHPISSKDCNISQLRHEMNDSNRSPLENENNLLRKQQELQRILKISQTEGSSMKNCHQTRHNISGTKYLMPNNIIEKLNEIEMIGQHIPVIIIHPIEGHVSMLKKLAKNIKYPVFGVQFTCDAMQCKTIKELANFYCEIIQSQFTSRVHLCGYGFGAVVALEMACQKKQICASLNLLDNGMMCVDSYKQSNSTNQFETDSLIKFAENYLITSIDKNKLHNDLTMLPSVKDQLDLIVDELMTKAKFVFDEEDLSNAAYSYLIKCRMLEEYNPTTNLNLPVVILIKPMRYLTELEKDLNQIYHGRVEPHIIDCDQREFLVKHCMQIASILNENFTRLA